jgi:hypothetical protein
MMLTISSTRLTLFGLSEERAYLSVQSCKSMNKSLYMNMWVWFKS